MQLTRAEVEKMSGQELVETLRKLTGKAPKKFSSRAEGIKRVMAALESGAEPTAKKTREQKPPPEPLNLAAREGTATLYRPGSLRGKMLAAMAQRGGASMDQLRELTRVEGKEPWPPSRVIYMLRSINAKQGCAIVQKGNQFHVDALPAARKRLDLKRGKEIKPPREGTKRHKLVGMLTKGATYDEITEAMGWEPIRTREALHLLNKVHGYRITEDDEGVIKIEG